MTSAEIRGSEAGVRAEIQVFFGSAEFFDLTRFESGVVRYLDGMRAAVEDQRLAEFAVSVLSRRDVRTRLGLGN
jgi:hypothetical protein